MSLRSFAVLFALLASSALAQQKTPLSRGLADALYVKLGGSSTIAGNLTVTGVYYGANGTAAAPSFSFTNSTGLGMFRSAADVMGFATAGVERWDINASGALNPFIDNTYDIGNGSVNPRDINISRNLVFKAASAKIIPGATSLLFRDNADANTNLTITDAGQFTIRGSLIPLTDNVSILGSASRRYAGLFVRSNDLGGGLTFESDGSQANRVGYTPSVGPFWYDANVNFYAEHSLQSLTATRIFTWPDAAGTIALTSSNVATATALAANPTNCSAGNYPLGIDASGNVESCTAAAAFSAAGSGSEIQARSTATTVQAVTGSSTANGGIALVNQSAAAIPLSVTGAAAQSGNLLELTSSGGTAGDRFKVSSAGLATIPSVTVTGAISAPGSGGATSEHFGASSTASGSSGSAFGVSAAAGANGTALGQGASATGGVSVGVSSATNNANAGAIAIGFVASASTFESIVLGRSSLATADGQFLAGGSATAGEALTTVIFGEGRPLIANNDALLQPAITFTTTGQKGTNQSGANITWQGGNGTGTGGSGSLVYQTAPVGTTGTTANTMATALTIDNTQTAIFNNVVQVGGISRLASNFTSTSATLANTAISLNVVNAKKYTFRVSMFMNDSTAVDGSKIDFGGGSATATDFRVHCTQFDTALLLSTQASSLTTAFTQGTVTGDSLFECYGSFEPSASGTFIVRAAQSNHSVGTLTLYRGSYVEMFQSAN